MEKVVYLLGAGFSAPLGLPATNDFLVKSKDMFFENPQKYSHFDDVFNTIKQMSVCKNYYDSDLFNIEEILSVLEMQNHLSDSENQSSFLQFICDVIAFYTPSFDIDADLNSGNWHGFVFGNDKLTRGYGFFVGSIHNLQFIRKEIIDHGRMLAQHSFIKDSNSQFNYSIVTLNYDMVLENICKYAVQKFHTDLRFTDNFDADEKKTTNPVALAKLHGSIDSGIIVPPTWNKNLHKSVIQSWRLAYKLLTETNHIRIIGYSLPTADSYVRYLLKAAAMHSPHLKSIDVICLDPKGDVKQRYDEFINFKYYRFFNAKIEEYLSTIYHKSVPEIVGSLVPLNLNKLEDAHHEFVEKQRNV